MKRIFLFVLIALVVWSVTYYVKADQLYMEDDWPLDFYINDIERDEANNYYLAGFREFRKYDNERNLIFSKTFGNDTQCTAITIDNDYNIYLICYENNSFFKDPDHNITRENLGNQLYHSHIIKLDSNGNVIFDKDLNNQRDYGFYNGIEIENDYIYIVGKKSIFQSYIRTEDEYNYYSYFHSYYIDKMDLDGNIISETKLGEKTEQIEKSYYNDTAKISGYGGGSSPSKETTILFNDNKLYTYRGRDTEIGFGSYSKDLEKIKFEEFGTKSSIGDICESNDGNYIAVGKFNIADFDSAQTSKTCPGIIKFSPEGQIIFHKIIEGKGEFKAIRCKDNGYYGLIYFSEKNINEYNNDSYGDYLVRYDLDFNLESIVKLSNYSVNLFDLQDEGIDVLLYAEIQHFNTEFDYKVNVLNPENGGKITLNEDREYYPNEEVTINVQEDEGYRLKEIQIVDKDGNQVELLDGNKFIMPSSEVTITPIFKKLNNKIIVVSKDETEDVKFEIEDITEVEDGTLVKMYITAVLGYEIDNIDIKDEYNNEIQYTHLEGENGAYSFIMPDSDVTITPNYRAITNNEEDKEKEDEKDNEKVGIVETIKTEVTNLYERINNPSTGDKAFELAFAGVAGIIVLLIVKAKRRKHSTKKSNILY